MDVTHPAFALTLSQVQQEEMTAKFLKEGTPLGALPRPIRKAALHFLLRGSVLAQNIQQSEGTFMTGLHTYLLKLGPEMLGDAYAKPVDRRIAASLPALNVRLRLQDVAQLMADALIPSLSADPDRPLHFVNIAGGPGIDSLNALLLLIKHEPGLLDRRQIGLAVLDLDDSGPSFGRAALGALSVPRGPLSGLRVTFRHVPYNWSQAEPLVAFLQESHEAGALVICSSEGGLFEYGSDQEITTNLKALRKAPEVVAVVGSVTRADEPTKRLRQTSAAATRPRGLAVFRTLIEDAGWTVVRAIERPFSDQVMLG